MAEMHTHRGDGAVFLWNLIAFLLRSARVEIFPCLHNFQDANAIFVFTLSANAFHIDTPHMQLTRHFLLGNTCVLFTSGNRYTFCYATQATTRHFYRNICVLPNLENRYILLYHSSNSCSISKESSGRYSTILSWAVRVA